MGKGKTQAVVLRGLKDEAFSNEGQQKTFWLEGSLGWNGRMHNETNSDPELLEALNVDAEDSFGAWK